MIWRIVIATICAASLWGVVSLSNVYETTLDIPVRFDLPADLALTAPTPTSLRVVVSASGWSLLKTMVNTPDNFLIRPDAYALRENRTIGIGSRDLVNRIRTVIPDAQQVSVFPDTITLQIGPSTSRRIPISPEATINTRRGFKVIGPPRLEPDSITIRGAAQIVDSLTVWPSQRLILNDIHGPVSTWAYPKDSLRSILTITPRRVELRADVQEIGERTFTDIPLINRITLRDTNLRTVLRPSKIQVLLRGGVRDLSRVDPASIRAYVEVVEGTDSLGIVYPRLLLPPGLNVSIVNIRPATIRYTLRRE